MQLDISQGVLNDFALATPLNVGPDTGVPGSVTQAQDGLPATAVEGASVIFTDHAPAIPDRVEQVVSVSDATGAYRARIPQGTWEVLVQAPADAGVAPPPTRFGVIDTRSPALNFILPAASTLPRLDGGVTVNGGTALAGASITAVDARGGPVSGATSTQSDGGYSLYLAPDAVSPSLQVGPMPDADAGVAAADAGSGGLAPVVAANPFPTYQPVPYAPVVDLAPPGLAALSGRVLDAAGNAVPSARVYARSVGGAWTLARSVMADADGRYTVMLRAGTYLVQAAPAADATAPGLSEQQPVAVPEPAANLTCPTKVRRYGQVLTPDGRPVGANFQVVANRLADALVTTRTAYTTPTDSTGVYHVVADGGRWRFEVVPPADAKLPRKIVQFDLDASEPGESALPPSASPLPCRRSGP